MIQSTKRSALIIGTLALGMMAVTGSAHLCCQTSDSRSADSRPAVSRPTASQPNGSHPTSNWPSYRGEFGRGVSAAVAAPTEWDIETGKHIAWKTPIPGMAHSSPVTWGDRIYLTTAVRDGDGESELKVGLYGDIASVADEGEHSFRVLCLDGSDGTVLWDKEAWSGKPIMKRHPKGSYAASTPTTDGRYTVAFFASEGLYCYDAEGNLVWKRDFGPLDSGYFQVPDAQWGFASSPVIHKGRVYLQCDVQKGSFVAALDLKTGEDVWRTPREEFPGWGTPTVHDAGEQPQLILNGFKNIGGYDLATGEQLWQTSGGGDLPVPTPVVAHDLAFITNAHGRMAPIVAISLNARGEFPLDPKRSKNAKWMQPRGGNYMQTPIVHGDLLYCCKDMGIVSCFDAKSGERHYRERLGGGGAGFTPSPVIVGEHLYYTSEIGDVFVVATGTTFEQVAVNSFDEICMASPAVGAGGLLFRTRSQLIKIAATE